MFPEAYTIGSKYGLKRITEWEPDYEQPLSGAFIMWEPPRRGHTYTVGVDPAWGVEQDYSAIHVLRNGTVKEKDRQVGEFCANDINPHDLVPLCYAIGNLYKDDIEEREALLTIEANLFEHIPYELRNTYNYGNLFIWKFYDSIKRQLSNKFGWWTTPRTRPKIITKAIHYIQQGWWEISSPWMIEELQTIEKLDDRQKVAAAKGFHDDLAMAGFIALWSAHDMEFNDQGTIEETAKIRDRKKSDVLESMQREYVPDPTAPKKADFQNTACSVEEMMNYEFPER